MENLNNQIGGFGSNIYLVGFMASGKTHWGRIWAAANHCSFLDLDELIEEKSGKTINEIFDTLGEDHFREIEAGTLRSCEHLQNTIIACGGGTPCYHNNMQWMNENGATVFITSTPLEILNRVSTEPDKRPLFKDLNQAEFLFFIEEKLKERSPFYTQAKYIISTEGLTPATLGELI